MVFAFPLLLTMYVTYFKSLSEEKKVSTEDLFVDVMIEQ